MANTIANLVASNLMNLTATNPICSALETTFSASNLFIDFEPDSSLSTISLCPYGGSPPNKDRHRQNPSIQIRMKTDSRKKGLSTQQEFIDYFTYRAINNTAILTPVQSAPISFKTKESGRWIIYVTNYNVKYIK